MRNIVQKLLPRSWVLEGLRPFLCTKDYILHRLKEQKHGQEVTTSAEEVYKQQNDATMSSWKTDARVRPSHRQQRGEELPEREHGTTVTTSTNATVHSQAR